MGIHDERQKVYAKMLADAEAEIAAMHPVKRWIGWHWYYTKEALKTDRAAKVYLLALRRVLGVDLYEVPHSLGPYPEWLKPRDIRLLWWHPVAWALYPLTLAFMVLTGGLDLVFENGNPFKKRRWHRRAAKGGV